MIKEIKARCIMQGLSLKQACNSAGIDPTAIYQWEEHAPSVDKVYKLSKVLGCSIEELCVGNRFK